MTRREYYSGTMALNSTIPGGRSEMRFHNSITQSCKQAESRGEGTFHASVAMGEMLTRHELCREQSGSDWM